jgi:hypothetical protein
MSLYGADLLATVAENLASGKRGSEGYPRENGRLLGGFTMRLPFSSFLQIWRNERFRGCRVQREVSEIAHRPLIHW